MRLTRLAITLVLAPLAAASAQSAAPPVSALRDHIDRAQLRAQTDSFVVLVQGVPRGWQRIGMRPTAKGWELFDAIAIGAMVQQSSAITLDVALSETALRQSGVMSGRPMTIALDFANGRVRGTADTPSNGPSGALSIDTAVAPTVVDDNAVTPLLTALRWRESLDIRFPVFTSGKATIVTYRLRVLGADTVTVPAGTFDSWRAELAIGSSTLSLHITRAAPYRILRMTSVGTPFDIQLAK
ncbi:hypothetical protein [Gemmatimonas groenlandica]|uniref:Uncharacterized protein n=1 Tax=Gemmatimonas groenlandica TaxID=2732249 RepID=A0A6M4IRI2_9BACT|nr:hypothetical protein [Gemmatimonas groenlandica]QJR36618.1 hypothetical protein HKW67_14420 [Gemmatimonas groenlandica]